MASVVSCITLPSIIDAERDISDPLDTVKMCHYFAALRDRDDTLSWMGPMHEDHVVRMLARDGEGMPICKVQGTGKTVNPNGTCIII